MKHAPKDYVCPICVALRGEENDDTWIMQRDIVYKDDLVTAFIGSKFIKGNEGHPIVVPNEHFENIYDLPEKYGRRVFDVSKVVASAVKAVRECDGIGIVQNNEPAGGQHAFHYHLHVFPRFDGDTFHDEVLNAYKSLPEDRIEYADALRKYLSESV